MKKEDLHFLLDKKEELAELFRNGMGIKRCANVLSLRYQRNVTRYMVEKAGLQLGIYHPGAKPKSMWSNEKLDELKGMASVEGATYSEIADHYGVTRNAITKKLNRLGVYIGKVKPSADAEEFIELPRGHVVRDARKGSAALLARLLAEHPNGEPKHSAVRTYRTNYREDTDLTARLMGDPEAARAL